MLKSFPVSNPLKWPHFFGATFLALHFWSF
jgi:hypothetical protein